jgi:outer membrane protein
VRFSSALRLAASISAVSIAIPAFAADLPSRAAPPVYAETAPVFTVIIAAGPEVTPSFPGSKRFTIMPSFHLAYLKPGEHDVFYTADDSFDFRIIDAGWFKAGPVANFVNRRGLSDGNGQFFGLHNVRESVELGGFAEIWPFQDHLRIRGEVRKAVTGHDGVVGSIGADAIGRFGPFQLSVGPRVKFGDQRYVDSYFSITPGEAALNGTVGPYRANGGLTSVGAFATARYDFNPTYSATVFAGYDRLASSVGSSPVATTLGTRDQFTGGITLAYTFSFGGFGILGY